MTSLETKRTKQIKNCVHSEDARKASFSHRTETFFREKNSEKVVQSFAFVSVLNCKINIIRSKH